MAASEAAKRKKAEVRRPDVCVCVCVHARARTCTCILGPCFAVCPALHREGGSPRAANGVGAAALVFSVCQEEALEQAKQTSLFQHKRASRTADTEPLFSGRVGGGYGYGGGLGGGGLFGGGPLFGR